MHIATHMSVSTRVWVVISETWSVCVRACVRVHVRVCVCVCVCVFLRSSFFSVHRKRAVQVLYCLALICPDFHICRSNGFHMCLRVHM